MVSRVIQYFTQHEFIRYLTVGFLCVSCELSIFYTLQYWHVQYLVSNTAGFITASIVGYFLQKYWTFKNFHSNHLQQMIRFAAVLAWGYVLGMCVLYLLVDRLLVPVSIAKLIQVCIVMVSNYLGQKIITFKKR